jgi:hypothetical protein
MRLWVSKHSVAMVGLKLPCACPSGSFVGLKAVKPNKNTFCLHEFSTRNIYHIFPYWLTILLTLV